MEESAEGEKKEKSKFSNVPVTAIKTTRAHNVTYRGSQAQVSYQSTRLLISSGALNHQHIDILLLEKGQQFAVKTQSAPKKTNIVRISQMLNCAFIPYPL